MSQNNLNYWKEFFNYGKFYGWATCWTVLGLAGKLLA